LGKLTAQHVTTMLRAKERDGLSPRTVAMIREVLRGALNVAVKMQMAERNAAALAPAPRQIKIEPRMLTVEEAQRLFAVTDQDRLAALYRLAIYTGMRQAEIVGVRWQDVDLDAGTLRVRQTLQRIGKEIVTKEPKTPRSRRTLALPPSLLAALVDQKDRQAVERAKAGNLWQESGLVFTTAVGTPLHARNLVREFKGHLRAAGLPEETRFYDLRHAVVSILIADGVPITAISAMLGHALTSTTLNTYAHVLPGADRVTADAMERLLGMGS
jgi:integrase